MVALIDDLGTWFQLGEVSPNFNTFTEYPILSNTINNTYRVTILSSDYLAIFSIIYIRWFIRLGNQKIVPTRWTKIFPNVEQQIINLPNKQDLLLQSTEIGYEIIKKSKFKKVGQRIEEENYLVRLEEFIPTEQTIAESSNINQIEGIFKTNLEERNVELITEVVNQLTQTQQQIQQDLNTITSIIGGLL